MKLSPVDKKNWEVNMAVRSVERCFCRGLPAYKYAVGTLCIRAGHEPHSHALATYHAALQRLSTVVASPCLRGLSLLEACHGFVTLWNLNLWMAIQRHCVRFEIFGGLCYTARLELVMVLCIPHAFELPGDYWILGHNSQICPLSAWTTTTIFLVAMSDAPGDF